MKEAMPVDENKSSTPSTDFGNLQEMQTKYSLLKLVTASLRAKLGEATKEENKAPVGAVDKPEGGKLTSEAKPKESSFDPAWLSTEELTKIEQTRFGIWLARTIILFMMGLVFFSLIVFFTIGYKTGQLPDITIIINFFKQVNDLFEVIL